MNPILMIIICKQYVMKSNYVSLSLIFKFMNMTLIITEKYAHKTAINKEILLLKLA